MTKICLKLLICLAIGCITLNSFGQSELEDLIQEREELYDSYDYLKDKKSSFFGTQSKKDLRKIIGNLKEIILMDSEIIRAIKRRGFEEKNDLLLGHQNTSTRNFDLEDELAKHRRLSAQRAKELKELEAELAQTDEGRMNSHWTILTLFVLLIIMILYNWNLRKRLKK